MSEEDPKQRPIHSKSAESHPAMGSQSIQPLPILRAFVVIRPGQKISQGKVNVRCFIGSGVSHVVEMAESAAAGLPRVVELPRVKRLKPKSLRTV